MPMNLMVSYCLTLRLPLMEIKAQTLIQTHVLSSMLSVRSVQPPGREYGHKDEDSQDCHNVSLSTTEGTRHP
jgi:hypothetical protein